MNGLKKPKIELIFQVAVVTDDLEKLLAGWKEIFDFDEESIVIKTTEEAYQFDQWDGFNYNEKHCRFFNKFCRFSLGGIDFEIIEPMDKEARSPFSDFLFENGGSGIHHIGVKVDDMPATSRAEHISGFFRTAFRKTLRCVKRSGSTGGENFKPK